MTPEKITAQSIAKARSDLNKHIHRTPMYTSSYLNTLSGATLFFKCENFQKTGSFKARGATHSVMKLISSEKDAIVATHSSGNHGQALAWAASKAGIPAYVVMPENAPAVKKGAVRNYGATIVECQPGVASREDALQKVLDKTGATFIPPYNYCDTIEGQASCAAEIFEDCKPDFLLCPVGGGGLLSGSALSAFFFSPDTKVIGCEPALADDAHRSFYSGEKVSADSSNTIADGLRTSLGDITYGYIRELVTDILLCSEEDILNAMKLIWERMKLLVEPSAAVPLACLLQNTGRFAGKRVAIVLSGGNIDLAKLWSQIR